MAYSIIYDSEECIGAGECELLSPELWKVENDGRAVLKGAVKADGSRTAVLEIDDDVAKQQMSVAESCPVGARKTARCLRYAGCSGPLAGLIRIFF